jgi:hypothetical protein
VIQLPQITQSSSELEVILVAAASMEATIKRNRQLSTVVTAAIEQNDFDLAIKAAKLISSTVTRDEQLQRVMEAASNGQTAK